ncbi:hypothetical protein F5148DRAFT_979598, partial [Russula earlei]
LTWDYLEIMSSSVSSKCAFLQGGITISKHCSCLKGNIVEALQCMKCVIQHDLLFQEPAVMNHILERALEGPFLMRGNPASVVSPCSHRQKG